MLGKAAWMEGLSMLNRIRGRVLMAALLAALAGGCAVQKLVNRGDKLLRDGDYAKAIATYEEALRVSPGNKMAHERIKVARREAVRARLAVAEQELSAGELPKALATRPARDECLSIWRTWSSCVASTPPSIALRSSQKKACAPTSRKGIFLLPSI